MWTTVFHFFHLCSHKECSYLCQVVMTIFKRTILFLISTSFDYDRNWEEITFPSSWLFRLGFFYCLCWYCDTYPKIVGSYLAYSFEINSFKIVDKHLENFMIDFSLYIFRDRKFSVLFIWSIYLAHLGKGGMWTRKYWGFKILKPYANMYILCMYTLSVKL